MYSYPKGRCSWLSHLNIVLGMVATYSKLIHVSTKNQESQIFAEGRLPAVKASGKICFPGRLGASWHPRGIPGRSFVVVLFWGSSLVSYSFFEVIFLFKAIQAINNVLKNFHVRTCKVSWVINTVETAMGCWKERHFTYKCKSLTVQWIDLANYLRNGRGWVWGQCFMVF